MLKRPNKATFSSPRSLNSRPLQIRTTNALLSHSSIKSMTSKNDIPINVANNPTSPVSFQSRKKLSEKRAQDDSSKAASSQNGGNSCSNLETPERLPLHFQLRKKSFIEPNTTSHSMMNRNWNDIVLEAKGKNPKDKSLSHRGSFSNKLEGVPHSPSPKLQNNQLQNNNSNNSQNQKRGSFDKASMFKVNLQQIEFEKKDVSPGPTSERKIEKTKDVKKWMEGIGINETHLLRKKRWESIRLSPKIDSLSPKFSHKMFVQNPRKRVPKLSLNLTINSKAPKISDLGEIMESLQGNQTDRPPINTRRILYEPYLALNEATLIKILQKLEALEFTVNMSRIFHLSEESNAFHIEMIQRLSLAQMDFQEKNHKEFVQRCGNESFEMLKEIFLMYRSQTIGLQKKDLLMLIKDFEILKQTGLKMSEIEVLFSRFAKKGVVDLKALIEIFYQLHKKNKNQMTKEFKAFFKEILHPKYNEYKLKKTELNIEKIFVFNKSQPRLDENMILLMLLDFRDVITHVLISY